MPVYQDFTPERESTLREIVNGLRAAQKRLPTRLLYDARGSELFEQICELDEYYLTRTELAIMQAHAPDMAGAAGADCVLIEYGSGDSQKTRVLLESLDQPVAYVPIDISASALEQSSRKLRRLHPELSILPVCADYMGDYQLPSTPREPNRRLVYFPGSTIGNFTPHESRTFLRRVADLCEPDDALLIGVDLHKDVAILEAAYDDREGITASFELNVLEHLNREFGTTFEPRSFEYSSHYNEEKKRIEMFLVSQEDQRVEIGGTTVRLEQGERILTEYSHKFTLDGFAAMASACGFRVDKIWTDDERLFSVFYLSVVSS